MGWLESTGETPSSPEFGAAANWREKNGGDLKLLYLPPARCHLRRRCASGPPRRPYSHGGTLLHAAPEPRGLVWGRPMGPPAPCPAAPGRLRARGPRAPRAAPCVTGTPERAGGSAVGAPRVPGPGPWSVPGGPPLSSLFFCSFHRKSKKERGWGAKGEKI